LVETPIASFRQTLLKLEAMPSHDQKVVIRYIDAVARTGNGRG